MWDVDCLEQFYNFVGKRLIELEKARKIHKDDIELEKEYIKMYALLDEVDEKLGNVLQYRQEVEDNGSSFAFERRSDNDEKPIVFENLKKEDIRYTPPRLEYLSKKNLQKDDIEELKDTDLLTNVNKFSYKNSGGKKKRSKKIRSKRRKQKTIKKIQKIQKYRKYLKK
jgi:hypothetical protein